MRKNILVTALGTMNCTTIVSELKKYGNYYIIGADINPKYCIATSIEVDEYYQFPKATTDREAYFDFVKDFCINHHIDYYFCVVDEEVETMAKHREEFDAIGVKVCVANMDAVVICHNKDKFAEWSEKYIPEYCVKRFATYDEIKDSDFPVFVKPIEGRASIGCKKINNKDELSEIKLNWNQFVVQEFIDAQIVAVDIIRNKRFKQFEVAQRLELLRNSNGCGISVEIINNLEIRTACEKIANLLDLNGVVNVEFFLTKNGPRVIEVNPRLPAGIAYSCLAGLDIVMNALRIVDGEKCIFDNIKIGKHYAKRYETYELD